MTKSSKAIKIEKVNGEDYYRGFDVEMILNDNAQRNYKLEKLIEEWKKYCIDLEIWFYKKEPDEMKKAMFKPNKPGYEFANND